MGQIFKPTRFSSTLRATAHSQLRRRNFLRENAKSLEWSHTSSNRTKLQTVTKYRQRSKTSQDSAQCQTSSLMESMKEAIQTFKSSTLMVVWSRSFPLECRLLRGEAYMKLDNI